MPWVAGPRYDGLWARAGLPYAGETGERLVARGVPVEWQRINSAKTRLELANALAGVGVELGVAGGEYSAALLSNPAVTRLYSIDRWADHHDEAEFVRAVERLRQFGHRSVIQRSTFAEAVKVFPDGYFDFVYIDGYAHEGQKWGMTLEDWWPKLRPGGVFAGHDYAIEYQTNMDVVDRFCREHALQIAITADDPLPSWATLKPAGRKIAVLCPGPSLRTFPAVRHRYDLRIGVNRAVGHVPCDYWVMLDAPVFERVCPLGFPRVMSPMSQWREVLGKASLSAAARKHQHMVPESVRASLPREVVRWESWSSTAAVALAYHMGATRIDCYGMDWEGKADFDGATHPTDCRDADRWRRERKCFIEMRVALGQRGVKLARIGADGREVADGD